MSDDPQGEVTVLLQAIADGNDAAKEQLFQVVYDDLRRVAAGFMRGERPEHTLQPTALLHEAYLKLVGSTLLEHADNRRLFFGAACRAMRQVLIDHAQKKKPPVGYTKIPLWDDLIENFKKDGIKLESLNSAMDKLKRLNPRQHSVIEMRYFGGLPVKEVAGMLNISVSSVEKDHKLARAFLFGEMKE